MPGDYEVTWYENKSGYTVFVYNDRHYLDIEGKPEKIAEQIEKDELSGADNSSEWEDVPDFYGISVQRRFDGEHFSYKYKGKEYYDVLGYPREVYEQIVGDHS